MHLFTHSWQLFKDLIYVTVVFTACCPQVAKQKHLYLIKVWYFRMSKVRECDSKERQHSGFYLGAEDNSQHPLSHFRSKRLSTDTADL